MGKRHAVIDIGSNTVRLVIFTGKPPLQKRLIDKKVNCGLARDLDSTGKLSPRGIKKARNAVRSYLETVRDARVGTLQVVATAAVRDARDGGKFVSKLHKKFGVRAQILSGDEEARLSALGVMSDADDADGLVVDLGGGSLELVEVVRGRLGRAVSAPLGHIRVDAKAAADPVTMRFIVERELSAHGWLETIRGKTLYLSGGAWRKMARRHMAEHDPKARLPGYTLSRDELYRLLRDLAEDSRLPKSLAIASSIVVYLLAVARPEKVTFSTRGLADGCLIAGDDLSRKAA